MTGLKYHRLLQGRTIDDLSSLTGIDKNTIMKSEEQAITNEPCHTYMRLAAALGITVDELLTDHLAESDTSPSPASTHPETIPERGFWEENFALRTGTLCRVYLARITGFHPKFHFNRDFQQLTIAFSKRTLSCHTEQLEEGVYEVCARWYKYGSNAVVDREVHWFAYYDGIFYGLDRDDVRTIVSSNSEAHNNVT